MMTVASTNLPPSARLRHRWPEADREALAEKRNLLRAAKVPPVDWRDRIYAMFPNYLWYPLSQPHIELWEWAAAIERGVAPQPFIALWSRGRGKSTHAEMVACDLGARRKRTYCLYVSETQDQADKHIATIAHMLESDDVTQFYPDVGKPKVGKNGSKSWNRQIVTTSNGYTVEAIGLNKAVRGQKIDWARPDLIIGDDIDAKHDTEHAVNKKIETLTTSILPAGAADAAVLFAQNLIHIGSVAHRLSLRPGASATEDDVKPADFLANRIISGPHKAVDGLHYEYQRQADGILKWKITGGRSLWQGFTLQVCEDEINRVGPTAFELESQHEIDTDNENALLTTEILDATRVSSHPDLVQAAVCVDPSGGTGRAGILCVGKARVGKEWHGYTFANYSTPQGTPSAEWGEAVLLAYYTTKADVIVVERNFGGDMAAETIRNAVLRDADGNVLLRGTNVPIVEVSASRGKEVRAQPVATLFQLGKAHHVGRFPILQKQWTQWVPGDKPSPDELDAEVWGYTYLGLTASSELPSQPGQESRWKVTESDKITAGGLWRKY